MTTNISPEAVEQLARLDENGGTCDTQFIGYASTLRALSAALTAFQAETAAAYDAGRADGKRYAISGLSGPLWRLILKEEGCFDKPCGIDDCLCRKQHAHLLKFAETEPNVPKGKDHE